MNALGQQILTRIQATGPMTVADYMSDCLMHPTLGYYTQKPVFGAQGDFVTAPEISQMFGEVLGLCLAQAWLDQGAPENAVLVELGPGRGTLMSDLKRATARVVGFSQLPVHLVEISPQLREAQRDLLGDVTHHTTIETLPNAPIFLIANEFFDALPIRQFQRQTKGWAEVKIAVKDNSLQRGLEPAANLPILGQRLADTGTGDVIEICEALPTIVTAIGDRIKDHGGAGLIIDYGDWQSKGDTLQAVQNHTPTDPLLAPGEADLTAHVDFQAIANTAPCAVSQMTPQGIFLERLGITARAQALAGHLNGAELENHIAAHKRLTHPDEMGGLFKVIGLAKTAATLPPGLEI